MAQDFLSQLFGGQPDYSQFMTPQQSQQAQGNALTSAGLNAAIALLGASGKTSRPVSTGQALGSALSAGLGGYQSSFDNTLRQMLAQGKLADLQQNRLLTEQTLAANKMKMEREKQYQDQLSKVFVPAPVQVPMSREVGSQLEMLSRPEFGGDMAVPETRQALQQNLPTAPQLDMTALMQALSLSGTPGLTALSTLVQPKDKNEKESFRPMTIEEKKEVGLPTNQSFQISFPSGKIDQISKSELVKNVIGGEEGAFVKKSQEKLAENYVSIADSGRTARRSLSDITRLESLIEKTPTGFGASLRLAAGNVGIATKGLSELQASQALINKLVPQQRPPNSGTMSDADLDLYKNSVVKIINQPGANKLIIESIKDINNYIIKEADIANQVLDGKISREEANKKFTDLGNPIQDFFNKNPSISGGSPSTKGIKFLGFEPIPTGKK